VAQAERGRPTVLDASAPLSRAQVVPGKTLTN
jgi:hypothetical protein